MATTYWPPVRFPHIVYADPNGIYTVKKWYSGLGLEDLPPEVPLPNYNITYKVMIEGLEDKIFNQFLNELPQKTEKLLSIEEPFEDELQPKKRKYRLE